MKGLTKSENIKGFH